MNPEKLIGIAAVALAPVAIVRNTKKTVADKIDQAKADRRMRKLFKEMDKNDQN